MEQKKKMEVSSPMSMQENPLTNRDVSSSRKTVAVSVELRVYSLIGIDSVRQEFECNFQLFLRWDATEVGKDWKPEYYFLNILKGLSIHCTP
jgi:hypothetical protein